MWGLVWFVCSSGLRDKTIDQAKKSLRGESILGGEKSSDRTPKEPRSEEPRATVKVNL